MSYFALTVVSANDVPIYTRDFTAREDDGARAEVRLRANVCSNARKMRDRARKTDDDDDDDAQTSAPLDAPMRELVVRAALDFVDERSWETNATYLRVVDRFNDVDAHAHCAPTRARMVLLTNGARTSGGEEAVRGFFGEVHEALAIATMNPMLGEDEALGERVRRASAVGGGAAVGRARARVKSAESDGV